MMMAKLVEDMFLLSCDDGQAWGRHVSVVLGAGLLEDVIAVHRVPKHIKRHSGSRSRAFWEGL